MYMATEEITTIRIHNNTKQNLDTIRKPNESYNDLLLRLIKIREFAKDFI